MQYSIKIVIIWVLLLTAPGQELQAGQELQKPKILIVLGSAGDKSTSKKLARVVQSLIESSQFDHQVIDLKKYDLPIINPEKNISHSGVDVWRQDFRQASAVVFLIPNYNDGYSGILKNGIDALGVAAEHKNIGLIAYSGGYSGGLEAVQALMPVLETLKMNVSENTVLIKMASRAFNESGDLKEIETKKQIAQLLDTLYTTIQN